MRLFIAYQNPYKFVKCLRDILNKILTILNILLKFKTLEIYLSAKLNYAR
ncbi:hypothetical protein SPLC1_S082660 [Arthrospira platensis C1]|uniref:Uncharacterized protein n=2 Tax=Limnospira TaxID=2596745 RepID=A0A9P1KAW9_9CYAN|nr:hypothetical protein AmaxDRAFT_0154 [Limnospira maxima CS-328]EKD10591.1 hypothetical protein SPLC1_S082660 [Arthrospira platensis C1]CDM92948.1 conserved protein of unknown function [Limnospira indica PCC 8005]